MPLFRERPVEARQVTVANPTELADLISWCGGQTVGEGGYALGIPSVEGLTYVADLEWVVKVPGGGFMVLPNGLFNAIYESAE